MRIKQFLNLLICVTGGSTSGAFGIDIATQELGAYPAKSTIAQEIISTDGRNILMVIRQASGAMEVLLNGTKIGSDEFITGAALNRDGSQFAYVSKKDNESVVILNGKSQHRVSDIDSTFSGDHRLPLIQFSPDGKHFGFIAKNKDNSNSVIIDNDMLTPCRCLNALNFSEDGQHWVCLGSDAPNGPFYCVVDGVIGKPYKNIFSPQMGPNGHTLTYSYSDGIGWGIAVGPYFNNGFRLSSNPGFSHDGQHFAIAGTRVSGPQGSQATIVIKDERNVATFAPEVFINDVSLSADGQHLAYVCKRPSGMTEFSNKTGPQGQAGFDQRMTAQVVVDGVSSAEFEAVKYLNFDPTGITVSYAAQLKGKWHAIIGKEQGLPYDDVGSQIVFSADRKHYAYAVSNAGVWTVVFDGRQLEGYELLFSEVQGFERRLSESSPIAFESTGKTQSLVFLAKKRDQILRVTCSN